MPAVPRQAITLGHREVQVLAAQILPSWVQEHTCDRIHTCCLSVGHLQRVPCKCCHPDLLSQYPNYYLVVMPYPDSTLSMLNLAHCTPLSCSCP